MLDSSINNWLGYLVVVLVGGRVSYLRVKSVTHKLPLAAQGVSFQTDVVEVGQPFNGLNISLSEIHNTLSCQYFILQTQRQD